MSDRCKHRWADSPSDVGEGIYCIRCGDMANVTDLRKRIEALEKAEIYWQEKYQGEADELAQKCESLQAELEQVRLAFDDRVRVIEIQLKDKAALKAKLAAAGKLPDKWRGESGAWQRQSASQRHANELQSILDNTGD